MLEVDNPFVNTQDIYILLYRYWMAKGNSESAMEYLEESLSDRVVTLEVR